jgi:uncharacterized protein (DUF697 family)
VGYAWSEYALPEFLGFAGSAVVAALIYFSRPRQSTNRRLALVLFVQGLYFLSRGLGRLADPQSSSAAYAWLTASSVAFAPVPFLYLHFLATLETTIVRPLRTRLGRALMLAGGIASTLLALLRPGLFIREVFRDVLSTWVSRLGPWWIPRTVFESAIFVFGLLVALATVLQAPRGTIARKRAKAYAIAFAVNDLLVLIRFLVVSPVAQFSEDPLLLNIAVIAPGLTSAVFSILLGYGILRTQLFDIDLKIKRTIRQGTVSAIFITVFFAVSEGTQTLVANETQSAVIGIVAASALVFVLAPLQGFAERVANMAMPGVSATAEYLTFRKFEVYKEALETILRDGEVTTRERAVLAGLQRKLGIHAKDAATLERDVRAAVARSPAPQAS